MERTTIAAALIALACSVDAPAQGTFDDQGFSLERLARLGTAYRAEVERGTIAGAVTLVARNGRIVHHEAHGYRDAARSEPMPRDAVFRMFSMTKPFTAVAAMMLVEQGRLRLSDPIEEWLPELKDLKVMVERRDASGAAAYATVPAERPIRVQDLLRNTAGFAYSGMAPQPPLNDAYKAAGLEWAHFETSDEFIRRLATVSLASQPGSRFQYGVSIYVLGVLLERLTGKRIDRLLDELIFLPLGMKDTAFHLDASRARRLADAPDSDPFKAQAWEWTRIELDPASRLMRHGGSGAVSTAADYFRFAQMLLNGGELDGVRLLGRKTVEQMFTDQLQEANPQLSPSGVLPSFIGLGSDGANASGYGLGFGVRRRDGHGTVPGSAGEISWSGFAGTMFLIDPKEKIVAISMAQGPSSWRRIYPMFRHVVGGALLR
jgi:CubicO group peptidase (beta-lactamase class C family)